MSNGHKQNKGTARAKRTGEKISKGLVKFYLQAGVPSITELRKRAKEKIAQEQQKK